MTAAGARQGTAACEALEAEFPGWHVWQSSHGHLWATRTGKASCWDGTRISMTLDDATEAGLRKQLAEAREKMDKYLAVTGTAPCR